MKKDKAWLKGLINEEGIVMDMHLLGRLDEQYWKNENIKINKGRLFYLIDQLDEPEKPVIPKFVADLIDAYNLHGNNPLREYRDLENDFNEGWTDEKDAAVYHWVNKNPYAFIDALRYGYEVEKEQKYHVVNKENYFMLRKYDGLVDILRISSSMSRDEYGKNTSFMLTEKEIKDYDERYWAFAEEVTE